MLRRFALGDQERVVLSRNGRFERILGPGVHWLSTLGGRIDTERHDIHNPEFDSKWADYLLTERRDVVTEWFTPVSTTEGQVAALYLDGRLHRVLGPRRRLLLWRGPFAYRVELFDTRMNPEVPPRLVPALAKHAGEPCAILTVIEEGKRGLLFVGGKLQRELGPGTYAFWKAVLVPRVEDLSTRLKVIALGGEAEPFRAGVTAASPGSRAVVDRQPQPANRRSHHRAAVARSSS
jgi:hypothetical protein